jgi:tRNA pseudouridine55 synthase
MNGILNILKPPGMTSFDVVSYLRGLLKQKKIGHAGTLDPGAVGVLPICIGRATKAIDYMMDKHKVYRAELTLGVETDTQDAFGSVIRECKVNAEDCEIINAIKSFCGKYMQVPPMYSAIKIKGKRLYDFPGSLRIFKSYEEYSFSI